MNTHRRTFIKAIGAAGAASYFGGALPLIANQTGIPHGAKSLPSIPYGAVYFRKSNPGPENWVQDYQRAAADGHNMFRHWFMWAAIEVAPGKYDWADYDAQFELAAKHGMKTVIGEMLGTAPQWAFRKWPHARVTEADGTPQQSHYTVASSVGGWPGLCLDNDEVKDHAEKFLVAMVKRYRDHPGMGAYDVWNELNQLGDAGGCYCQASTEKFRIWLKEKYGDLDALNKAWYRYSYASWEDVEIPRTVDPYPDSIDWALFRVDNATRLLKWRIDVIKKLDTVNPVTAHAIPYGVLDRVGPKTYPVFQAGRLVDIYGYTGGGQHTERYRARWRHWMNMDLTRSAAYGKPYWCGEMAVGAAWRWKNQPVEEGRISSGEDVTLYSLMHFAGGTRGVFCPRWRPLQDGWHVGNFAFYGMDGKPTDRSEAASHMANWANHPDQKPLLEATPVKSQVGILVIPESQIHCYVTNDNTEYYYRSISGAYQGFLFNNIQVDFVYHDEISEEHKILYLPHPLMLHESLAQKLTNWVKNGGTLISEGCPAYFGNNGRAGIHQPHYGMDQLFGVEEEFVQFTPDLLDGLKFSVDGLSSVKGGLYLQTYNTTTGKAVGQFEDGRVAVVDNQFGKGRTRLVGTFPGYAYGRSYDPQTRQFFSDLLSWAGETPHVATSDERIVARLQTSGSKTFLWAVNATRAEIPVEIKLSPAWKSAKDTRSYWGSRPKVVADGKTLEATISARDCLVAELI